MPVSGDAIIRYFEHDRFIGQRLSYCCSFTSGGQAATSSAHWPHVAYVCPTCGNLWGRAIFDHQFTYAPLPTVQDRLWAVEVRRCAEHGDGTFLTGQLTDLHLCDKALLAREAFLLSSRG